MSQMIPANQRQNPFNDDDPITLQKMQEVAMTWSRIVNETINEGLKDGNVPATSQRIQDQTTASSIQIASKPIEVEVANMMVNANRFNREITPLAKEKSDAENELPDEKKTIKNESI